MNWIVQCGLLWLASFLSVMFSRFIHVRAWSVFHSFLLPNRIPLNGCTTFYSSKNPLILSLAVLGLYCRGFFSGCVHGLLAAAALSCRRARALERLLGSAAAHVLVAPQQVGSSWTRSEPVSPALSGGSLPLNHQGSPTTFYSSVYHSRDIRVASSLRYCG